MKRLINVGDIVLTKHEGIYLISSETSRSGEETIKATTLDTDYIGTICYTYTNHKTVSSLLDDIEKEEGIEKVISREDFQKLFDFS